MGNIVRVNHPVPLLCRHRTPGQSRVDFVQAVTPVRLRYASRREFEEVARYAPNDGKGHPVYVHEGGLWFEDSLEPERLISMLETPAVDRLAMMGNPARRFRRSPLLANWADGPGRGLPPETRKVRRIVADGTERARHDLARYLDGRIRIVEGALYRRCDGPVALHAGTVLSPVFRVRLWGLRFEVLNMLKSEHVVAPRPDRAVDFWAFESRFHRALGDGKVKDSVLARPVAVDMSGLQDVPATLMDDEDLMAFAWDGPFVALRNIGPAAMERPGVREAAERLHPWVALGLVGATRPDELAGVAEAMAALGEALARAVPPGAVPPQALKLCAYARDVALPLLRPEAAVTAEDEDAMAGLAP